MLAWESPLFSHITFDPYFVLTSTQPENAQRAEEGIVGETSGQMNWLIVGLLGEKTEQVLKRNVDTGSGVCVCERRVMRSDQRDGKPSRLLTQTHQWESNTRVGEGGGGVGVRS